MEKTVKVGFAGVGWMGEQLIRRLHENPDSEVTSVFDINKERTADILQNIGIKPDILVNNFEELINNPDIDAIFIATPNTFHGPQATSALKANKHVFCEKPAATKFDDFLEEIELDKQNPKLMTMVDYILKFDPMANKLNQMIADDWFGQITQIQINYRHPVNISGDKTWKLRKDIVGDAIGMGPIHAIFAILWYMQTQNANPSTVYATATAATTRGFEVPPIWNILIEFDNGTTGLIQGNIDKGNRYDAYHNIYGTKGGFVFDSQTEQEVKVKFWSEEKTNGKWVFPLSREIAKRDGTEEFLWPENMMLPDSGDVVHHQTRECVAHFIDSIKTEQKSPLSFANSSKVAEVGFAALVSAKLKSPVKIPLDIKLAKDTLKD